MQIGASNLCKICVPQKRQGTGYNNFFANMQIFCKWYDDSKNVKDIFFPNFGQLYYIMKPKDICKQDPLDIFICNFYDTVGIVEILNLD